MPNPPSERLEYWDISPEITPKTAVFPGDEPFKREVSLAFSQGHHLELSSIRTTVHIGAHTDAPIHYHPKGESIEARRLDYYLGRCQVITVKGKKHQRILPEDIAGVAIQAPRVLFRTLSFPKPDRWTNEFTSLSPELIESLAAQGVVLVGIDTPSVDPADSKALETHQAIHRFNMAILEGVVLEGVSDGIYSLVALPLRLKGLDASPVRAVLLREGAL